MDNVLNKLSVGGAWEMTIEQQQELIAGELVQSIVYGETRCGRCGNLLAEGDAECVNFTGELTAELLCADCYDNEIGQWREEYEDRQSVFYGDSISNEQVALPF